MGLFDVFKRKKIKDVESKAEENKLIIAMPMFGDKDYSLEKVIEDLKAYWGLTISEVTGDDETAILNINGETVAIGFMPAPIPQPELESMFSYSYLWKNAENEVKEHKYHAIVSILGSTTIVVERYKILTRLIASIFRTTPSAIGLYQGDQTLLLPKPLYLDFADFLLEDDLPIPLWIYLGVVNEEKSSNIYTFGLKEFNKKEIEIINSSMKGSELYDFMLPVLSYILGSDVTLQNGETIGFTAEQKIKIKESKGVYLEGNTLKFEM